MRTRRLVLSIVGLSVALSACSGSRSPPSTAASPSSTTEIATRATPPSPASSVDDVQPLLEPDVTYAAVPRERYLPMYRRPEAPAPAYRLDTRNASGMLAPLLVMHHPSIEGHTWLQLQLPLRPNGRTGWVRPDDVRLVTRDQRIVVDLSQRVLRRFVDGRLVDRISVGVGTPSTPTAVGTFFVWVKVPYADPSGPYGAYALGLSGFSPVLSEWPGGGRMAIHGTANPGDRGRDVSHGCVRVYNPDLRSLRAVPLGTPVVIRR